MSSANVETGAAGAIGVDTQTAAANSPDRSKRKRASASPALSDSYASSTSTVKRQRLAAYESDVTLLKLDPSDACERCRAARLDCYVSLISKAKNCKSCGTKKCEISAIRGRALFDKAIRHFDSALEILDREMARVGASPVDKSESQAVAGRDRMPTTGAQDKASRNQVQDARGKLQALLDYMRGPAMGKIRRARWETDPTGVSTRKSVRFDTPPGLEGEAGS